MSTAVVSDIFNKAQETKSLSAEDLLALRRAVGADMAIDAREADILFQINDSCDVPYGWSEYFITVITTFLIHQTPPEGYVSDINAAWLLARINHDSVVETQTELGLLLNILKVADNVTDSVEKFALDQVVQAVLHSKGHLARSKSLTPGVIGDAEVEMLRKVLYAVSSEGGIGISRLEAETLFNLNEATSGTQHSSGWQKLFVCGIANHLMMSKAYEEPNRNEALRREKWLKDTSKGQIFKGFLDLDANKISDAFKNAFGKDTAPVMTHMDAAKNASAERVTAAESQWLIERLNRDGGIDANERALLEFLAQECPDIHSALIPLIKAA